MKSIKELVVKCHSGDSEALSLLTEKMTPLVKKYARLIHFMEYEDALQEFFVVLINSIRHLDTSKSQNECLKYMEVSIQNHYHYLCKQYLSSPQLEYAKLPLANKMPLANLDFKIIQIDFENYMESLKSNFSYKRKGSKSTSQLDSLPYHILYLSYKQQKSNTQIASILNVSPKYVSHMKRQLITKFIDGL